jgi:predicted transcriptional regulator
MTALRRSPDRVLRFMRLMWKIDHDLQSASRRMESTVGLTSQQRLCVLLVGRHPRVTPSGLAALLHLDRGTITGIVRRLEAAGFVAREAQGESCHYRPFARAAGTYADRRILPHAHGRCNRLLHNLFALIFCTCT